MAAADAGGAGSSGAAADAGAASGGANGAGKDGKEKKRKGPEELSCDILLHFAHTARAFDQVGAATWGAFDWTVRGAPAAA